MARKFNLTIDQGADYSFTFDLFDQNGDELDVTGYSGRAALKPWYTYGNTVSFDVTLTTGSLEVNMTANTTASIQAGRYVYDAELERDSDGNTVRVVEGLVTIEPQVA